MLESIIAFVVAFAFFFIIIGFVFYVLNALALMKIADKFGETNGWVAWIPLANVYLLGKLGLSKMIGWIMVLLSFLQNIKIDVIEQGIKTSQTMIPQPFISIIGLASFVFTIMALYKIYRRLSTKAVVMTVFSVLTFGLLAPIFLFAIRNNEVIAE